MNKAMAQEDPRLPFVSTTNTHLTKHQIFQTETLPKPG